MEEDLILRKILVTTFNEMAAEEDTKSNNWANKGGDDKNSKIEDKNFG